MEVTIPEKSKMDRIEEKLDELLDETPKKKKKKQLRFKPPFKSKVSGAKLRDNYVTVIKINENRNLDFLKEKIVDQTIMVDGVPRLAGGEHILSYKNKPMIIIPTWSVKPFSPGESYKQSLTDGSNSAGYRLLMNKMQSEAIKLGKKIGGLGIGIGALIIVGIIVYSLVSG